MLFLPSFKVPPPSSRNYFGQNTTKNLMKRGAKREGKTRGTHSERKKTSFLVLLFLAWKTVEFVDRGIGRSCLIFESPSSLHPFHALFGVRVQQNKVIEKCFETVSREVERDRCGPRGVRRKSGNLPENDRTSKSRSSKTSREK